MILHNATDRKRYLRYLALSLLIISNMTPSAVSAEDEKQLAQDFTLKSNSGKNIKLSELRGQVIMLNFWASWCGTCIKQLPILNKFHHQYKDKGFSVLAVNIDENSKKALKVIKKHKLKLPVLFDTYNHVSRDYAVSSIPVSILIDRDGYLRDSLNATKINKQKHTRRLIEELLNE